MNLKIAVFLALGLLPRFSQASQREVTCQFDHFVLDQSRNYSAAILSTCSAPVEIARGIQVEGKYSIVSESIVDQQAMIDAFGNIKKGNLVLIQIGHRSGPYGEADFAASVSINGTVTNFYYGSLSDAKGSE